MIQQALILHLTLLVYVRIISEFMDKMTPRPVVTCPSLVKKLAISSPVELIDITLHINLLHSVSVFTFIAILTKVVEFKVSAHFSFEFRHVNFPFLFQLRGIKSGIRILSFPGLNILYFFVVWIISRLVGIDHIKC